MRIGNPSITKLSKFERTEEQAASIKGIVIKAILFAMLTFVAALASYLLVLNGFENIVIPMLIASPIVAIVCALVASFAPSTIPVSGSLYCVFQGFTIGFVSCVFELAYSGIIFAALISTVIVFTVMTVLFATGIIRVGGFFRKFMISALIGICASQLVIFLLSLFIPQIASTVYGNGFIGLIVSLIMVVFASLMILFDLDNIARIVGGGMDKKYEWMASFGLITTLIWLYVEFLRLFAILASRKSN